MKQVCSLCDFVIMDDGVKDNELSHGYCPECSKAMMDVYHGKDRYVKFFNSKYPDRSYTYYHLKHVCKKIIQLLKRAGYDKRELVKIS